LALDEIPDCFDAVLSGHMHRAQVLREETRGRNVYYPGSTERTAFAEREETKGFLILTCGIRENRKRMECDFVPLPVRPMRAERIPAPGTSAGLERRLRRMAETLTPDTVLRLDVEGVPVPGGYARLSAMVREIFPPAMNLEIRWPPRP
jgi:DNA repair exonuclease SbcCD nuclease subunit